MNIAVYGGSFNPLHIGHLAIIRHLTEKAGFDGVYLIVSPKNPLKDSISGESARERYNAAVEAIGRHFGSHHAAAAECGDDVPPTARGWLSVAKTGVIGTSAAAVAAKVKVDAIEMNMPAPHYTIRTLNALKEREPANNFTLIMGADNLAIIRRWKDYESILTEFGIAVFPREGHDMTKLKQDLLNENPAYKIQLLDAPLVTVSSTEIREALSRGEDVSHLTI